ncbi:MAG: benzoyl-CoA reductase subunit C [Planctomycetota bacterium]|nr:MAG: benzoyl-CoA reductase subunit C [Planctomycetota bacterium]
MNRLQEILQSVREETESLDFPGPRKWKQANPDGRCVGFFPVYCPVEILDAAGVLPVALFGGGEQIEVELADARVQSFICSISRSTLELGLTDRLDFMDGMLFGSLCDVARNLSGVWARNFPDTYCDYLHFPQNLASDQAMDFYVHDLKRLAGDMAQLSGKSWSDEDLALSLDRYESLRARLRKLQQIRCQEPWRLSLEEFYCLLRAAGRRKVEAYIPVLDEVISILEKRDCRPVDGIRVVLEGSFCEQPSLELIRSLDQAHCFVVESDLARGMCWFQEPIQRSDDPWLDLARAYFKHAEASVVRHRDPQERSQRLLQRVQDSGAEGVIFCTAKFCEPAFYDFVLHKRVLEQADVPYIAVEFEEKMSNFESIRTQAETFSESILFFGEEAMA